MGGNGVVIKTAGMDIAKMVRKEPSCAVFSLTRSTAQRWSQDTGRSADQMIRETLDAARQYASQSSGESDLRLEALLPCLRAEVPTIVQAHTESEIRAAIELAKDFGLRLIIAGGIQAYRLRDELAQINAGVILGNSGSNIGEYEPIRGGGSGYCEDSAILLHRAGVKVSFFGVSGSRRVMPTGRLGGEPALNAAWLFRNGATEQEALRMLTLEAAEIIGIEDRIGSLDVGKDPDFQVLEGHPFDYRILPQMVFIDGKRVN